ncbi:MAG: methionine--tRNA ligase [bacterium]|nr:methionine--tRNA ligase [bacterium]
MKRILVTSALPYANGPLHIGHVAGVYLPADIYVRYQKLRNRDIIHICGTDEHGVLITIKAKQEHTTPQAIVDKYHADIKSSFDNLGIKFDNFSRTSKPIHEKNAQEFFLDLYNKGFITPKTEEQLYCDNCKQFLPERFVEGTCPFCGNDKARGDQCEACGRWLEPTMLKEPKCQICHNTPTLKETNHWFLRLDLLQEKFKTWISSKTDWRENVLALSNNWLKEGLEPRAITRDINWGVPVPLPEARGKVIYVWFEALLGYISATKEWDEKRWADYWLSEDTQLVHFLAKDNIVFHAIVFPCMLMAHGDFILPSEIPANEFMNLEGKKISTSRNWAVWIPEYLKSFDPDPLRYVLTINAPEKGDVDFSWDDFMTKNNNELSDILGNLINRTLGFINKYLNNKIPAPKDYTLEDTELLSQIVITKENVEKYIEGFEFKLALKEVMALAKEGNKYFDYQHPWEHNERTSTVIYISTVLVCNLAALLSPFLPFTSDAINNMLGFKVDSWDNIGNFAVPSDIDIKEVKILFKKLDKAQMEKEKSKLGKALEPETPAVPEKPTISYDDFKKLDIRVGEIKEAVPVAKSEKLLKLKVLVGDKEKQILAGIAKSYSPESLVGKKVIILANLEPRKMMGEISEGMVLAASDANNIVVLTPEKDVPHGSPIS